MSIFVEIMYSEYYSGASLHQSFLQRLKGRITGVYWIKVKGIEWTYKGALEHTYERYTERIDNG